MADKHIDDVTGIETTGHVWDGDVRELNKPLPRWWVWVFYASIVWSIGYWVVYPAWPTLGGDYTKGIWNYSQRAAVTEEVKAGKAAQAKFVTAIDKAPLAEVAKNQQLLQFAMAGGAAAFGDNCAPCHGRGAQGSKGYPNLADDDWLWGGTLDEISKTIGHGVRSGDKDTRDSAMPRFGLDKILTDAQINDAAEFVLLLAKQKHDSAASDRGGKLFAEQCAACHGEKGLGNKELGAPNLTDGIWLYGGAKADIVESIRTGRGGVMPTWAGRLDPVTIKMLAVYVHSLGGGK
jgi:cytochrome c oxidase cbb3-type subunit 3